MISDDEGNLHGLTWQNTIAVGVCFAEKRTIKEESNDQKINDTLTLFGVPSKTHRQEMVNTPGASEVRASLSQRQPHVTFDASRT